MIDNPKEYYAEKCRLKAVREAALEAFTKLSHEPKASPEAIGSAAQVLRKARHDLNKFVGSHSAPRAKRFKYSFIADDGSGRTATIFACERGVAESKARKIIDMHSVGKPPVRGLHLVKTESA